MIVETIDFEGFFLSHERITIKLPSNGIVLVTGPNGAGKSAIVVEAVATACWGKTWRGTPPWNEEHGNGLVRVTTPDLEIQRAARGQKLLWNERGEQGVRYDTPSKAQQALADVLGTFDTWRRTHVFSSQDAAHFSLATDKERKLLLETILGLERFDPALKQCRRDLADSTGILRAREAKISVLQERIAGLLARLEDLEETEESENAVCGTPLPEDERIRIELQILALADEREKLLKVRGESHTAGGRLSAQVEQAERECRRLDHDNCPTCAQPIPGALRDELRVNAKKARTKLHDHARTAEDADKARDHRINELLEQREKLREKLRESDNATRDRERVTANAEQRSNKRIQLVDELKRTRADLAKAQGDARVMRIEVAELDAVESVLGLKGVRAHILGGAMEAITALANGWLARLFPGVSIELQEVHDKVELEVLGLPHKYGYRGSSSGQRRRVDIALLLALSDLEAASRGVPLGTLMLDEVADTLDAEDGILAFTNVIQEVSEERCVVIISHNPALMEGLDPRKRLHVQKDGTVLELKAA